jgi:hypothetical protein
LTPDTVHLIAQEIRQQRAVLTVEETWLKRQRFNPTRDERYRRILFWRVVLKYAEEQLASGTYGEYDDARLEIVHS